MSILFFSGCSGYEPPSLKELPFKPVSYGNEVDDEASELFGGDGIYRIVVDIAEDLFDIDSSDGLDYTYTAGDLSSSASFVFYDNEDGDGEPQTIQGIGMRLRGAGSFYDEPKHSYTILFPGEDNRFYGLASIKLNSLYGDNSFMREKLACDFFHFAGIPSSRTAYARLYFFNEAEPDTPDYKGLYLIVEDVNQDFFESRFGLPVGNCYQNNGCELDRVPLNNWEYLSSPANPLPLLELVTNPDDVDCSDIIESTGILNTTPPGLFEETIQDYFCAYELFSAFAVNSLTGMIDAYWFNPRNFYLYNYYGRFMWIPLDLNSSFGVMWAGFDPVIADIYAFQPRNTQITRGERPLIDCFMQVPGFVDYYRKSHKYFIEHYFNEETLYPRIDELKVLILNAVLDDDMYQVVTEQDITDAIEADGSDPQGLKAFIRERKGFVWSEVENAYE